MMSYWNNTLKYDGSPSISKIGYFMRFNKFKQPSNIADNAEPGNNLVMLWTPWRSELF